MKRLHGGAVHGSTQPWWTEEAPLDEASAPLQGEVEADVAIVGGGLAGLWTARSLLERKPGLRVVIVEALRCGEGASARNGGFLHGYWSSLPRLVELLGPERALELARSGDGVFETVRELGEDVWLREGGMLMVSTCSAHDAAVHRAIAVADRLGVPEQAEFVPPEEASIRFPAFRGVVFWKNFESWRGIQTKLNDLQPRSAAGVAETPDYGSRSSRKDLPVQAARIVAEFG